MNSAACRFCGAPLRDVFCDLGTTPLSNAFLTEEQLAGPETFYPLRAMVCSSCFLVQLPAVADPGDIFREYAYFSSYSQSWLEHSRRYAAAAVTRFGLGADSLVVELASNDGYLLQYFLGAGVPVLGVEPALNVAEAARAHGVETVTEFFGTGLAERLVAEGRRADLVVANNVLAHVPNLNDFVGGIARLLAPRGRATLEFPHLLRLIEESQFDTIYHEHFSYFSFLTAERVFTAHGLRVFDVEELPTHGGSLRVYLGHDDDSTLEETGRPGALREIERSAGLDRIEVYRGFDERVRATKRRALEFLVREKEAGKRIAAYGAAAKGNTFLGYCGIRSDLVDFVVDRNPYKQGRYLPGTRIPIGPPELVRERRPDYLLILAWNLREEIVEQMAEIRDWGGRFLVLIPRVEVIE